MKVLVIHGAEREVEEISFCLRLGYPEVTVLSAANASAGIQKLGDESPDLVVINSTLPDTYLALLVRNIRGFSDVPLLIVSDGETDVERAKGLEAGADGWASRPLSPVEFLATVRALLRRIQRMAFKAEDSVVIGSETTIDFAGHRVFLSGNTVKLTPIEHGLLYHLVRNEGRVMTHSTLLEAVWGSEYRGERSFLKKYIYRLRRKLGPYGPQMLITERGVGYRFIKQS